MFVSDLHAPHVGANIAEWKVYPVMRTRAWSNLEFICLLYQPEHRQASDDWVALPVDPTAGDRSRTVSFSPADLQDLHRVANMLEEEQGATGEQI